MSVGQRVLVAEDTPALREAMASVLQQAGYQVRTATSVKEALRTAEQWLPDLVLLQVELPEAGGLALCQQIRRNGLLRHTRVVLLCKSDTSPDERAHWFEAGADDYICLPVTDQELLARVHASVWLSHDPVDTEEYFHAVFSGAPVGICLVALNGRIQRANAEFARMLGRSVEEVQGLRMPEITHPADLPAAGRWMSQLMRGERQQGPIRKRFLRSDGTVVWAEVTATPLRGVDDAPRCLIVHVQDVSTRVAAEQDAAFYTRLLRMLSETNQVILHCREEKALLQEICRVAVEYGEFPLAVMAVVDRTEGKIIPAAAWGRGAAELEWTEMPVDEPPCGPCCLRVAISHGRPVVCNDIEQELETEPWSEEALNRGFRSCAAFPFFRGGEVAGALRLFAEEKEFFQGEQLRILEEIAGDLTFALESLDKEAARAQAVANQTLALSVLELLNTVGNPREAIQRILKLLREHTNCGSATIWFREGAGIASRWSSVRGEDPSTCADSAPSVEDGRGLALEGLGQAVLRGGTDPALSYFTPGGSFWTNDLAALAASDPQVAQALTADRSCAEAGYKSVALVPLRCRGEVVGLLQLADRTDGCFSSELMGFLERVSESIGIALCRRRAQEELAASEQRFRDLADLLPQVVFECELDGRITFANQAALLWLGYTPEDLKAGLNALDMLVPEDRPRAEEAAAAVRAGEAISAKEFTARRRDGSTFPVLAYLSGIRAGDQVVGLRGLLIDITERQAAEKRIRASRQLAWTLLDAVGDAALLTDPDGTILAANTAAWQMLRPPEAELVGQSLLQVLPAGLAAHIISLHTEAVDTQAPVQREVEWEGKSLICRVHLVRDENDNLQWIAVSLEDITDLRRAADVQKLAALGELAAGVGHDFNNLLAAMMIRAELQSLQPASPDVQDLVDTILRACRQAAEVCRNLMAFARPEEPRREITHIHAPLEAAVAMAHHQMEATGVQVERDYEPEPAPVYVDVAQMQQVFLNLIINACHAMPNGGTLTLRTRHDDRTGEVLVTVRDTGCGIAPEHLPRVFEPYFTTKGPLGTSSTPGTGLGLPVSRSIITAHGGTISLTSEVGIGTQVTVRLPMHRSVTGETSKTVEPGQGEANIARSVEGSRVLVMDDDEEFITLLSMALHRCWIHVTEARTVDEALEALRREAFDLLIADVWMPDGGVSELLERAGGVHELPPVMALSATARAGYAGAARCGSVRAKAPQPG